MGKTCHPQEPVVTRESQESQPQVSCVIHGRRRSFLPDAFGMVPLVDFFGRVEGQSFNTASARQQPECPPTGERPAVLGAPILQIYSHEKERLRPLPSTQAQVNDDVYKAPPIMVARIPGLHINVTPWMNPLSHSQTVRIWVSKGKQKRA